MLGISDITHECGCVLLAIILEFISCRGPYIVRSFFICQVGCEAVPYRSWVVMQTMGLDCLEGAMDRNRARVMLESIGAWTEILFLQ